MVLVLNFRDLELPIEEANEKLEDLRVAEKLVKDWNATNPTMSDVEEGLVSIWQFYLFFKKSYKVLLVLHLFYVNKDVYIGYHLI